MTLHDLQSSWDSAADRERIARAKRFVREQTRPKPLSMSALGMLSFLALIVMAALALPDGGVWSYNVEVF